MSVEWTIPPALLMFAGAVLLPFLPQKVRSSAFLFFCLISLLWVCLVPDGTQVSVNVMGHALTPVKVDALARVFAIIFAFIALAGGIYAFHLEEAAQQSAALLYAGSALGVVFAGDYFTLLVFWDIMALASTYLVWARRTEESRRAGFRYLMVHVFGGASLFAGILMHAAQKGTLEIGRLAPDGHLSTWLILIGVGLNAAIPPIHAWLPDAYPKATVTGAVFMSAFTTKAAVYGLLRIFPGWKILLIMGVIMTVYGVIFAIISNDIRGILAYHIVSQVGYMVAGAGIGTEMSMNGSAAHAFSHILYKALLFMGAGVVLETTRRYKLTELGGLAKSQKLTLCFYMVAAFSISGVPFFNGFISKSMVVAAAGEANYGLAMLFLNLASVGTFLSVGLKLPYFTWLAKEPHIEPKEPPKNMHIGMGLVALLCIGYGIFPSLLYKILPFPVHYDPYSATHLIETIQLLTFAFVAFWLLRNFLKPKAVQLIDFDWLYRKPVALYEKVFVGLPAAVFRQTDKAAEFIIRKSVDFGRNPTAFFSGLSSDKTYTPDRYRPTIQALVAIVLAAFIILSIIGILFVL